MVDRLAELLQRYFNFPVERSSIVLRRTLVGLSGLTFVVLATLIVAFESLFVGVGEGVNFEIGSVASRNIIAPAYRQFASEILTDTARQAARDGVMPIYDPPDPDVASQQTQLLTQIGEFIENVRRDPYGTTEQKLNDLNQITALTLEERIRRLILEFSDDAWAAVEAEASGVLQRVMRGSIQESMLPSLRAQLPTQVTIRFNRNERDVIVAIVEDLLRPNTFENVTLTQTARDNAATAVQPVQRTFLRGETIVDAGAIITAGDYEALRELGILRPDDVRTQELVRALLANTITLVIIGLFLARFEQRLIRRDSRMLVLLAALFLTTLLAARFLGVSGNIYLFPSASLALLLVAIHGWQVAMVGALGLAFLVAFMAGGSLEVSTIIGLGSIIGILALRQPARLNSYFVAGTLVGLVNAVVVVIFNFNTASVTNGLEVTGYLFASLLSGALLVPATTIAAMYALTQLFNLPTALKLLDLSQPNKPLLQRLLREAPGTYQHSLQVANLAQQACEAIGADAQLVSVAALYHDIGKMLNPIYFTENQPPHLSNPHDTLNDPQRSASIIIDHVIEGDEMARQYRLPNRLRDFIREHHGTTQVYVFYQRALNAASDDPSLVDITDFTYPGPRPRSRESGVLLLADSCEATIRSVKPETRQEISDLVHQVIDDKRKAGQLDESGLTLNDLHAIQMVFVDILQGMFHPRINYREAVAKAPAPAESTPRLTPSSTRRVETRPAAPYADEAAAPATRPRITETTQIRALKVVEEAPMNEVPRLTTSEKRRTGNLNGSESTDELKAVPSDDAAAKEGPKASSNRIAEESPKEDQA